MKVDTRLAARNFEQALVSKLEESGRALSHKERRVIHSVAPKIARMVEITDLVTKEIDFGQLLSDIDAQMCKSSKAAQYKKLKEKLKRDIPELIAEIEAANG